MSRSSIIFDPIQTADAARLVFELINSIALQKKVTLKATPVEPTSCCGRGCDGCVWSAFVQAAEHWRQGAVNALDASLAKSHAP
jgi:hypothetical protein